nr:L,D-transpeptidase family protein [Polymorphobacter multimanifer]
MALAACQPTPDRGPKVAAPAALFTAPASLGSRPAVLLAAFENSAAHNRDAADYATPDLIAAIEAARSEDPQSLRAADARLTQAFLSWAHDLATPRGAVPVVTDPEAANPPFDADAALQAAAAAPDLAAHLQALQARHPLYEALVARFDEAIAAGEDRSLLAANLERARALPPAPEHKHIVVDAAGARLWMFEGRRQVGTMKTVIGRPDMPTPLMSGMIRHVVSRPYWNLPEDIVRDSVAPAVLRRGLAEVRARDLEIMSDWSPEATPLDASDVDWQRVASGDQSLRVRQRPGPRNMMGRVKFMLPNELGIYLHDTPKRSDFALARRARSSGCVRLEDAARLATWLFDGNDPLATPGTDRIVPLPAPVPVHISYFTLAPTATGLARNPDIYRRDAAMMLAAR